MATMTQVLTADSPEVRDFLDAWHESGRAGFVGSCPSLDYDGYDPKRAVDRKKYIALDRGTSGVYLVDKATGEVWTIAAYGRPNRRYRPVPLAELTTQLRAAARPLPAWYDRTVHELVREAAGTAGRAAEALGVLADRFADAGRTDCEALARRAAAEVAALPAGAQAMSTADRMRPVDAMWRELWRLA